MDLKPWDLQANANPTEFRHWRMKYYLGLDMGVTNIPGQQANLVGCLAADIEQNLYSVIGDNNPVFTPEPNDEILSCMDYIYQWITKCHSLNTRQTQITLTWPWTTPTNQATPPSCPSKQAKLNQRKRNPMSTIGVIAHTLLPLNDRPAKEHALQISDDGMPQTVQTRKSYLHFKTNNYRASKMHWFWMVLISLIILYAWWKICKHFSCPGLNKKK